MWAWINKDDEEHVDKLCEQYQGLTLINSLVAYIMTRDDHNKYCVFDYIRYIKVEEEGLDTFDVNHFTQIVRSIPGIPDDL